MREQEYRVVTRASNNSRPILILPSFTPPEARAIGTATTADAIFLLLLQLTAVVQLQNITKSVSFPYFPVTHCSYVTRYLLLKLRSQGGVVAEELAHLKQ